LVCSKVTVEVKPAGIGEEFLLSRERESERGRDIA